MSEAERQVDEMQQQIGLLQRLMEGTTTCTCGEAPSMCRIATSGLEVKLTKLSAQDDVKAYLTTFERVMGAYRVEETW